jgi:O-methyltransferase involved in polyketide biosynthesis
VLKISDGTIDRYRGYFKHNILTKQGSIMNEAQGTEFTERNFNAISPSAKSLLFMKGHTNIPFARQTAELMAYPEKYIPDFNRRDITYWARTVHFENRYWSINQLLNELPVKNILELSSGYSFRSLEIVNEGGVHYIDTDLPDMIETKKNLVTALQKENNIAADKLELLPLNALDENQFKEVVSRFPEGEIVIVNEGLLMYLNNNEKEKLCKIIYNILKERGGFWITADIYLKSQINKLELKLDKHTKDFFEQHNIEDNKFNSFDEAKLFFNKAGFTIDKEAHIKKSQLSALKYLIKSTPLKQLFKMSRAGKMQATWRLKVAKD